MPRDRAALKGGRLDDMAKEKDEAPSPASQPDARRRVAVDPQRIARRTDTIVRISGETPEEIDAGIKACAARNTRPTQVTITKPSTGESHSERVPSLALLRR